MTCVTRPVSPPKHPPSPSQTIQRRCPAFRSITPRSSPRAPVPTRWCSWPLADRAPASAGHGGHRGRDGCHQGGVGASCPVRSRELHRPRHGRVRHGEGAHRPRHSSPLAQKAQALHRRQRGRPGPKRCWKVSSSGTRRAPSPALSTPGGVSSSLQTEGPSSWTRSARCPGHADQAPSRARAEGVLSGRWGSRDPCRRPHRRCHEPGSEAVGGRGPVQAGPLLPVERAPHRAPAAPPPPRRYPPPGGGFHRRCKRPPRPDVRGDLAGGHEDPPGALLARQHSGATQPRREHGGSGSGS